MRIGFYTDNPKSPSSIFYNKALAKINNLEGCFYKYFETIDANEFEKFDVILFFGKEIPSALFSAKNYKLGVVDPRQGFSQNMKLFDFALVNGIEAKDYFSSSLGNIFVYWVFPEVPKRKENDTIKEKYILSYHGNPVHLAAMYPKVTNAMNQISRDYPIQLLAMYKYGGGCHKPFPARKLNFEFRSVPFSFENYERYISSSDIGLIPQTIPVRKSRILRFLIGKWTKKYNEKSWDYLIRFKETTNIGRVMVFAQYGIPVVSDMTPSSCRYVDESLNGFIAHSEGGWYAAIKSMLGDSKLRHQLGRGNYYMYHKTFHPEVQNRNLIKYINERIIK